MALLIVSVSLSFGAGEFLLRKTKCGNLRRFLNTIVPHDFMHAEWYFNLPENFQEREKVLILDRWINLKKEEKERRILFIGDSGTRGVGVQIKEAFPYRTEDILRQKYGLDVLSINAGVPGMYPAAELDFLKQDLIHLSPDMIVLGIFIANDITFNFGHKETREVVDGRVKRAGLIRQSAFNMLLSLVMQKYGLNRLNPNNFFIHNMNMEDEDGYEMTNYIQGEFSIYRNNYTPTVEKTYNILEEVLSEFKSICDERKIPLIVALIPTYSTIAGKFYLPQLKGAVLTNQRREKSVEEALKTEEITDEALAAGLDFERPNRRICLISRRLNIPCVDPLLAFREQLGVKAIRGDDNDDHLSVSGHLLLGNLLSREIYSGFGGKK